MAAGDLLIVEGTPIVFGVGDTVTWTPTGVVDGAGRESDQHDVGPSPRTNLFNVRFYTELQAGATLDNTVDLYIKRSNGTIPDNDTGIVDAAVTTESKLRNLLRVGPCIVDQAAANVRFVLAIEEFLISARYIQAVLWNRSGASISATAAATKLILTPITYQTQSS